MAGWIDFHPFDRLLDRLSVYADIVHPMQTKLDIEACTSLCDHAGTTSLQLFSRWTLMCLQQTNPDSKSRVVRESRTVGYE